MAGARPDTQGVPLTRWSLDRLSATWPSKASGDLPDASVATARLRRGSRSSAPARGRPALIPTTRPETARVLELYARGAVRRSGDQLRSDGAAQPQTDPGRRLGCRASVPNGSARPTTASTGSATSSVPGRAPRPALRPDATPPRWQRRARRTCARSGTVYPARQRIYWIQDNLSANWTPDIRAYAAAQQDRARPDPTYASYLNRIESHFRPIQEFVFNNTDYPDWDTAQRALAGYITHRNGERPRPPDRRPRTQTPHRRMNVIQVKRGWTRRSGPTDVRRARRSTDRLRSPGPNPKRARPRLPPP